jgi:hypothetical protein
VEEEGGRRPEEEEAPAGGPHLSARGEWRRGAGGPRGPKVVRAAAGRREGKGWAAGWVCFLFFFKSFLKTFKPFQIQIFSQISPTIFKGFSQTLLTTFQTYFKFKPSFF